MHIVLDKVMPNGSLGKFHELVELIIRKTDITAVVNSLTAIGGMVCWQARITIPGSLLAGNPYTSALEVLTRHDGYLANGTLIDNPTEFEQLRTEMLTRLTRMRDDHLVGGCDTPFGRMDTDMVSRQNVSGAVSMASIAKATEAPFSIKWRMQTNTYTVLDADMMIGAGVLVGMYISAVYEAVFAVKDTIDAAETVEELQAIDLDTIVWPS
jgi:hypothetical protein